MSFKGLPTPAAAGTVCSLVLLQQWFVGRQTLGVDLDFIRDWARITEIGMVFITLLSAIAMVSVIRYPHLANRFIRDRAPIHYVGAAIFLLIPLLIFPQITLAIGFTAFALWGPIAMLILTGKKSNDNHREDDDEQEQPPLKLKEM
jgi:phosphatidylserine synthase